MNRSRPFSNSRPSSPLKPLVWAIRSLIAGSVAPSGSAAAEPPVLPTPASILVAPGNGRVLPPVVNGNTMTITQLSDKATLNWQSFNIGVGHAVRFDQPSATSVALNNIRQADPSRILGTLTANGQVYLVNQNGFVFGKDARINVNTLVATTLNISEAAFQSGLVRVFDTTKGPALEATDEQGRPIRELYLKDDKGANILDRDQQPIKVQIRVESGARLRTNAPGGRILLAAPSITNKGSITAPDGQVILAASQDKVYLQPAPSESGVRGLLVEVGTGGDLTNLGRVIAERGNASLIGFAVNQRGLVSATTSVNLNGSVRLLAREGVADPIRTAGKLAPLATKRSQDQGDGLGLRASVVLGPGSETSVRLDNNKQEKAPAVQDQLRSQLEISGHTVAALAGSTVRANAGEIRITASDDPSRDGVLPKGDSRLFLERGSVIDASGVKGVKLPSSRNTVEIQLRKSDLRDAPLQRDGILFGKTVRVDIRDVDSKGQIPIADVKGALDRVPQNIDERSTRGGSIKLDSSGDLITQPGSLIDFSGGSVRYAAGLVNATKLISGGKLYDIGTADPNRKYDAILGQIERAYPATDVTEKWNVPVLNGGKLEPAFEQGKDAGSLDIAAFDAELDGILNGHTISGIQQRAPGTQAGGSRLDIDLVRGLPEGRQDVLVSSQSKPVVGVVDPFPTRSPESKDSAPLTLDPDLFAASGIRQVSLQTNGQLRIEAGKPLALPANASLTLKASGFDLQAGISSPGGHVSLAAPPTLDPNIIPSTFVALAPGAALDVAGQWVNDALSPVANASTQPIVIDGGKVALTTEQGDLSLAAGSRIDVSGGGWLQPDGTLRDGKGGTIELVAATHVLGKPASLDLDGELIGAALKDGGSLTIRSNEVVIGSTSGVVARPRSPYRGLALSPEFFDKGGFARFDIGSNIFGLSVADGTQLNLVQRNLLIANPRALPTGARLNEAGPLVELPEPLRQTSQIKLSFLETLGQRQDEALSIGKGAAIRTDPLGSISLVSDTSLFINGTLDAPAGAISASIVAPAAKTGFFASQSLWLGNEARLSVKGVFDPQPNSLGLRLGEVHPGGRVSLEANRGYLVTETGSSVDVSGTSARLDFPRSSADAAPGTIARRVISSSAGSINLAAGEGLIIDGALTGKAGGPDGAAKGSLGITLDGALRGKPEVQVAGQAFPDDLRPTSRIPWRFRRRPGQHYPTI